MKGRGTPTDLGVIDAASNAAFAERLLERAMRGDMLLAEQNTVIAMAQVYATLALAEATRSPVPAG